MSPKIRAGLPMRIIIVAFFCLGCVLLALPASGNTTEAINIKSVAKYLDGAKIHYQMVGHDSLTFQTSFPGGKSRSFLVKSDSKHHCLYIAITGLGKLEADDKNFCSIAKKLLVLNFGITPAKLEWDESSGDIRLSKILETDIGLNRSHFFKSLQTLLLIADNLEGNIK